MYTLQFQLKKQLLGNTYAFHCKSMCDEISVPSHMYHPPKHKDAGTQIPTLRQIMTEKQRIYTTMCFQGDVKAIPERLGFQGCSLNELSCTVT